MMAATRAGTSSASSTGTVLSPILTEAGVRYIDLVFANELLCVFGVKRDIRLAVVLLEIDLAPQQTAGCIDFLDRQVVRHHDRLAVDVEHTGIVVDGAELDR